MFYLIARHNSTIFFIKQHSQLCSVWLPNMYPNSNKSLTFIWFETDKTILFWATQHTHKFCRIALLRCATISSIYPRPFVSKLVILSDFHSVSVSETSQSVKTQDGGRHGALHGGRHGGGHGGRHYIILNKKMTLTLTWKSNLVRMVVEGVG